MKRNDLTLRKIIYGVAIGLYLVAYIMLRDRMDPDERIIVVIVTMMVALSWEDIKTIKLRVRAGKDGRPDRRNIADGLYISGILICQVLGAALQIIGAINGAPVDIPCCFILAISIAFLVIRGYLIDFLNEINPEGR